MVYDRSEMHRAACLPTASHRFYISQLLNATVKLPNAIHAGFDCPYAKATAVTELFLVTQASSNLDSFL